MKNDCEHTVIKCMKCFRYLEGDPNEPMGDTTTKPIDSNGYAPVTCEPNSNVTNEGFHITKGPLLIEVFFTTDGVHVGIWDKTDEEHCFRHAEINFNECMDPCRSDLVQNPDQLEIEPCMWKGDLLYEHTQISIR